VAKGLVRRIWDIAPYEHALVVVVNRQAALHHLGPLLHDLAVLAARAGARVVHAVDRVDIDRRQIPDKGRRRRDLADRRERNVGIDQKTDLGPALGRLPHEDFGHLVVEHQEGVGVRLRHEVLVVLQGDQLLVLFRVTLINAVFHPQHDVLALGVLRQDLRGDVLGRAVVGDWDVEHCLPRRDQLLGVGAEVVAAGDHHIAEEITPHEFVLAGGVADPAQPVAADFKRRRVGVVEFADFQLRMARNALAEFARHVPAAAPAVEQLHGGVVMAVVVRPGGIDTLAVPPEHDRIGPQERIGFGGLLQNLAQRRFRVQGRGADDDHRPVSGKRRRHGFRRVGEFRRGAAHPLDKMNQIRRRTFFPNASLRRHRDDCGSLFARRDDQVVRAGISGNTVCALSRRRRQSKE
jgi:hypothetical protein